MVLEMKPESQIERLTSSTLLLEVSPGRVFAYPPVTVALQCVGHGALGLQRSLAAGLVDSMKLVELEKPAGKAVSDVSQGYYSRCWRMKALVKAEVRRINVPAD
jgi:hypothetical protein